MWERAYHVREGFWKILALEKGWTVGSALTF